VSSSRPSAAKAAQIKIAQQRASQRRSRQVTIAAVSIGAVVVLFAALIIAKVAGAGSTHHTTVPTAALKPASVADVVAEATNVPPAVLDQVGVGALQSPPAKITAPPLTSAGKPEIMYFGYEWCPYCATERWPLVVALSRFGTFSGLSLTESSSSDVYPSTNTFTFAKATYTSQYLAFDPIELQDANRNTLETPTAAESQVLSTYDAAPYVPSSTAGSLPFVDLGGSYLVAGASYDPQSLAGQSWDQIAGSLATASSPVAQGVDGTANALTAAMCSLTHQQPAAVCTSTGVTTAQGKL
jgi:hypothetical protein